jgi:hypothetical protein
MNRDFSQKGFTSVISVILLLFIMIIATVALFNFYKSTSSEYKADIESQVNSDHFINFNYIESDILYYENSYDLSIGYENIKIDGETCVSSNFFEVGMNSLSLSSCSISTLKGYVQVTVTFESLVYSEYVLFKDNY